LSFIVCIAGIDFVNSQDGGAAKPYHLY